MTGFNHLLRNTSGEASLGGSTHQLPSARQAILQFFAETRAKSWDRKFVTNLERICRGCIEKPDRGWELIPRSSCQEITRLHVTEPANLPRGSSQPVSLAIGEHMTSESALSWRRGYRRISSHEADFAVQPRGKDAPLLPVPLSVTSTPTFSIRLHYTALPL